MRRLNVVVACLVTGTAGMSVSAQDAPRRGPGGGGAAFGQPAQQLSPEKARGAWEMQVKGVVSGMGLSEDQTAAAVKAYAEARTSHAKASDELRRELMGGGEGRGDAEGEGRGEGRGQGRPRGPGREGFAEMQRKMEALADAERTKLHKSLLAAGLTSGQTDRALASLGTFNRQWDAMTSAIAGLGLGTDTLNPALKAMEEYVVTLGKARSSEDREAMRETMQEARRKLSEAMKGLLSEEQFGKFQASLGRGEGRGGPGGEGRGGPGGRGGGGGGGGR